MPRHCSKFYYPSGVAVDATGNVYVADEVNNKIRNVSPTGVVTTLAGTGIAGSTDGTGTAASFDSPAGVAVDTTGNVYVADEVNCEIRKIALPLQSTPLITWPAPPAINYGTALSSVQLDATANVPGTFAYSPSAGTVLDVGSQTLSVTFTPTDTTGLFHQDRDPNANRKPGSPGDHLGGPSRDCFRHSIVVGPARCHRQHGGHFRLHACGGDCPDHWVPNLERRFFLRLTRPTIRRPPRLKRCLWVLCHPPQARTRWRCNYHPIHCHLECSGRRRRLPTGRFNQQLLSAASSPVIRASMSATSTSTNVSGLSANTTYYYRVEAYDSTGTGTSSGTITVTTIPPPISRRRSL